MPTDLLVELLGTLATYNVTVSQLKLLVGSMKADADGWVSTRLHIPLSLSRSLCLFLFLSYLFLLPPAVGWFTVCWVVGVTVPPLDHDLTALFVRSV